MKTNGIITKLCLIFIAIFVSSKTHISFSQTVTKIVEKEEKLFPIASDCNQAIKISPEIKSTYGLTVSPNGAGKIIEASSGKKNDLYFFEKEHNSAWYCFEVKTGGNLVFNITPLDTTNDYDFLLFKYTDSLFCKNVANQKIKPIRSNISRTGHSGEEELTGLTGNAKESFVVSGKGFQYSKFLEVKTGEKYYLVLDNVYPNGKGHKIEIGYERQIMLKGKVLNEENKPLKNAEIILEDQMGREVAKTKSNANGDYMIQAYVWTTKDYNIVFFEDSSFVAIEELKKKELLEKNYLMPDIRTVLPKLKKGGKYVLGAIEFYPNSSTPLPSAYSSIKALHLLMKKNPQMKISIEGHVNDPSFQYDEKESSLLSKQRAETIAKYLLSKKINTNRMTTVGYGSKYMLFPNPKTEIEMSKNRRVEIKILLF